MTRRRRSRWWATIAAAGLSAVALGAPTASGQEVGGGDGGDSEGGLAGFEATADAYVAGVSLLVSQIVPLPIDAYVARAQAKADSAPRATAVAGPVDVPIGAALGVLGIPIGIPTSCTANYPGAPSEVECGGLPGGAFGSLPLGAAAGRAEASGDQDSPTSPRASALTVTASQGAPLFTYSQGETESQTYVEDDRVIADAALSVGHLELASKLLDVRNLSVSARAESTGRPGEGKAESKLSMAGGNIAGFVPFDVTTEGIVFTVPGLPRVPLLGFSLPLPPGDQSFPAPIDRMLRTVLTPLLDAMNVGGFSMKALPATERVSEDGGLAEAVSGGLEVIYAQAGESNEYRVLIGQTKASAFAPSSSTTLGGSGGGVGEPVAAGGDDGGFDGGSVAVDLGEVAPDGASPATGGAAGRGGDDELAVGDGRPERPLDGVTRLASRFRATYAGGALGIVLAALACFALVAGRNRTLFSAVRRNP